MFKIIAVVLAMTLVAPAFASDGRVYTDGLSTEQELQLKLQVEKLKKENSSTQVSTPIVSAETLDKASDKAAKYTEIGVAVAKGLAGAAKELGVAVNEFALTPVGQMTMFLVIWNFFGGTIVHLVAGFLFFVVMIPVWFYVFRRYAILQSVTYTPVTPESKRNIKTVKYQTESNDRVFGMIIFLLVIIGIGITLTFV